MAEVVLVADSLSLQKRKPGEREFIDNALKTRNPNSLSLQRDLKTNRLEENMGKENFLNVSLFRMVLGGVL